MNEWRKIPMSRRHTPDDIAHGLLYFALYEWSFMTGAGRTVEGGHLLL